MPDKKHQDVDYLFLSTMLRARTASFINEEVTERMLAAGSYEEAASILAEIGWPDMSEADSKGVDAALSARREEVFEELARLSPDIELVDLYRLRYDYHNAKAIVKAEAMGTDANGILSNSGRIAPEKIREAFFTEDYRFIPPVLGKAMSRARDMLAKSENPQLSDFILDEACYAEMAAIAEKLDSRFVKDYVRLCIDSANLRSCVRCSRMKKDSEFLGSVLLPGGNLDKNHLASAVGAGDGIASAFAGTALKEAAVLGAEAARGGRLTAFELKCDNTVIRFMRSARMHGFGPECVAGYIAASENDITSARIILTGLLSGLSAEHIRERLRDNYV